MRLDQHHRVAGIAENGGETTLAQLLNDFPILLSEHERNTLACQCGCDVLPDAAMADENDLTRKELLVCAQWEFRHWIAGAFKFAG